MKTTIAEAIKAATFAADKYSLPQTVYRDADSCGWAHTNFASGIVQRALWADSQAARVTMLPAGYFR